MRRGIPPNFFARLKFFWTTSYIISGHVFTLDDIENGVLRGNRKAPAHIFRQFSRTDPRKWLKGPEIQVFLTTFFRMKLTCYFQFYIRLQFALPTAEPRIHFALVCGARSCPPIKCYSEKDVDSELNLATEAFFEDDQNLGIKIDKRKIYLNKILDWYSIDFGKNQKEVLIWIYEHMSQVSDLVITLYHWVPIFKWSEIILSNRILNFDLRVKKVLNWKASSNQMIFLYLFMITIGLQTLRKRNNKSCTKSSLVSKTFSVLLESSITILSLISLIKTSVKVLQVLIKWKYRNF